MRVELNEAEFNYPEVDFWPLIKDVRVVYGCLCYALFWSCVMCPVLVVLGYGVGGRDLPGSSLFSLHLTWQMVIVWLVSYGLGFIAALPHILWLAAMEHRRPSGRFGVMVRSIKIGVIYGFVQGLAVWWFAAWRTGHTLRTWPLAAAFYVTAVVCGYIAGRIEVKSVPIEG